MPGQAPSLDLLRALRRATCTLNNAHTRRPCRIHRSLHIHNPQRFIASSRSNADQSQSKPATHPLPTATSSSPSGQTSSQNRSNPYAPRTHDRGPASKEDTQTDFGMMDIYANVPNPATSIDACTSDGFHLDNGIKITGYAGLLVAGGEAWSWRPWLAIQQPQPQQTPPTATETTSSQISTLLDSKRGILTIPKQSLGLFALLHPKPDLLILGTGSKLWMLAPDTKRYLMEELGMRVDVTDTANASATYNLLAKERGVEGGAGVAGAFLPIGWKGPESVGSRRRR